MDTDLLQASIAFSVFQDLGERVGRHRAFRARYEALKRHEGKLCIQNRQHKGSSDKS